jgi:hypothetical protein
MRSVKLTGREASVVRAIGFTEGILGSEILEQTRMEPEDITDTLNSLMSAGFVESEPYYDQVPETDMLATAFEINPAYAQEMKGALYRR